MKKIIVTSLTLAFASAAQSAVLLEKVVERSFGGVNSMTPNEPERSVKKTCSIQDNKKMVIKYETGDLVSSVTYTIQIDKNLIARKITAVTSEVKANGDSPFTGMGYISTSEIMPTGGNKSVSYVAYNKKTKVPLLTYADSMGIASQDTYKANSETATNLKNLMDLTCENLPTITESSGVR
jgi:hypothetical protein